VAHESFARDDATKGASDRAVGLVFAALFGIVALLPLLSGDAVRWWSAALAAGFAASAFVVPRILRPLTRFWMRLGLVLHSIVSPIVLAIMFYLVVTPTGALMRLARKDPLRLRRNAQARSYWVERVPPGPSPESLKDQF